MYRITRHPGGMPCSKRKTDLLGRNIGTLPNHCTLLFVIIFIALKVHCIRIGLIINATCVFGSIELRQFGFLLLWFVIFQPRKIKAFGYWLFLIKNTPKYKVKPMPPLKIYWLECSVHIIFLSIARVFGSENTGWKQSLLSSHQHS